MRCFFAATFLFFTIFLCFSQSPETGGPSGQGPDWYQGKPIKDIRFMGLKSVRLSELESVVEPYKGGVFSDALYLEIQSKLYALEYFELITPTAIPADSAGGAVILQFAVVERPTVSKITFLGNAALKRRDLISAVTIKVNDVANTMIVRSDEEAVRNRYVEKGFPDVRVRSEIRAGKNNTVEVLFHITEGERIIITDIYFEGNTVFSNSTLRGRLSMKAKGIGPGRSGAFQDARLMADREALTRYYHDRGYLDAEVTDVVQDVVKDKDGNNNMVITYRLYEGRIYVFNGIRFEGNEIFTDEQLQGLVRSETGKAANASRIEADLQRVADLYYENGYIFNSISREESRDTGDGLVSFTVQIAERGRAHIENIVIRGNKKTKDSVILREIPLEPGDVFSKTKVMTAFRNLMNLQYFSNVLPEPAQGSDDSLMDLIINLEEAPTMDIQFGLTFSGSSDPGDFPVSGILAWTDRNFLGYGNQVKAETQLSTTNQSLSLQYSQRWLGNLPLSWGVDLSGSHATKHTAMNNGITGPVFNGDESGAFPDGFYDYNSYLNAGKLPRDEYLMKYDQWYISLGLSSTYRWYTLLGTLGAGGGIRTGLVRNSYDSGLRPFDPVIRERNQKWTPVNSIWTLLYLDNRDLYYDPSQGYYGSQRFSFYGFFPIELEHYIRSDTKAEFFFTLFDIRVTDKWHFKSVLALHSGLSFIFPQLGWDEPVVEDTNKLYIDGMFVGRGWLGERTNRGFALWENWAEIRFPLVPNLLALDWFFDADVKKDSPRDFFGQLALEDWRFSLGGGLRFTIPQFPFRFLLAKRFRVVDGKVEWQQGGLFQSSKKNSGLDFVISFAIPTS
ncbi:MAG: outer membrane protein assembly factor BamA [Treponema sp.]|jgi:outer membrane protein insertion porin family|nr:outer membrane protein assembly factor BamA [Treponema sp.]